MASVKEHYRVIRKEGDLADPENLVNIEDTDLEVVNPYKGTDDGEINRQTDLKVLAERIAAEGYDSARAIVGIAEDEDVTLEAAVDIHVKAKAEVVEESLFDKAVPVGPDGEPRDPQYPYVISIDEWAVPEDDYEGYEQVSIKYYAGDNTLLDTKEEIVLNVDELVGVESLTRFGHLSQDDEIVYVRNERLGLLIEIVRIEEGYAASKGLNFDPDEEEGFERQRRIRRKAAATED